MNSTSNHTQAGASIRGLKPIERFSLAGALVIFGISCGAPQPSTPAAVQPETARSQPVQPKAAPETFESLRKQLTANIVAAKTDGGVFYKALLEMARRDGVADGGDAPLALVRKFANEDVGLFVFDSRYDELLRQSPDEAARLADTVSRESAGTAVARAALDRNLQKSLAADPKAFLAKCDEITAGGETSKEAGLALLRKVDYYRLQGDKLNAALASLRYCTLFPDSVKKGGLNLRFAGVLRQAGFILESELIEKTDNPAAIGKIFLDQLGPEANRSDAQTAPPSFVAAYIQHAPDLAALESALPKKEGASVVAVTDPWNAARLALLAANDLDSPAMAQYDRAFVELVSPALAQGALSPETLDNLYECGSLLTDNYFVMLDKWVFSRKNRPATNTRPGFVTYDELTEGMANVSFSLWEASRKAHNQEVTPAQFAQVVDSQVAYFEPNKRFNRVISLYTGIAARFPDTPLAPTYLLKLAKLYLEATPSLNKRDEALQVYKKITSTYPNSPEASQARIGEIVLLYESSQYEQAYSAAQALLATNPADENAIVSAKLVSALSTAGLGSTEDAEKAMQEITENNYKSPLAAQAYFWLGSNALGTQNYDKARSEFQEIVDRYPDSTTAVQARQYLDRLKRISQ